MSSTNRGSKRKENDFYSTPEKTFKAILPYLPKSLVIHEPACGDARLVNWMLESGVKNVTFADITSGVDFLEDKGRYPIIVTNPPFSLAQEFVSHSLEVADETFMLLRLNFLGAQKRAEWWKKNEPDALFVLSERPDFTGGGGDSCEYAWYYFGFRYMGIHHI